MINELSSQQKIWLVVQSIPAGKVSSYGQIADLAGLPGRARLVGKVLGMVPESGFNGSEVPWYRVLRASGQIAFPVASDHYNRQRAHLLDEGVMVKGRTVSMKKYAWQPSLDELMFKLSF